MVAPVGGKLSKARILPLLRKVRVGGRGHLLEAGYALVNLDYLARAHANLVH